MVSVDVQSGDITEVQVNALITTTNTFGFGPGVIDLAITRLAGSEFHNQLKERGLEEDGVLLATSGTTHHRAFQSVLFVLDDWNESLAQVVLRSLNGAEKRQLGHVSLPLMRTGAAHGMRASTKQDAMREMAEGITAFMRSRIQHISRITLVIYNDPAALRYMKQQLDLA